MNKFKNGDIIVPFDRTEKSWVRWLDNIRGDLSYGVVVDPNWGQGCIRVQLYDKDNRLLSVKERTANNITIADKYSSIWTSDFWKLSKRPSQPLEYSTEDFWNARL